MLVALCVTTALAAGGCGQSNSSPSGLPVVRMKVGAKNYYLEVANTAATRQQGLMRRDSMPDDHGMIFVFRDEEPLSFWMKNTRIPLLVVYVDHDGKVVSTAHMKPYDETSTPSAGPAKYAIELNDDQDQASGVMAGQTLRIPELPAPAKP